MRKQDIIASSTKSVPTTPFIVSVTDIGTGRAFNDARVDVVIGVAFNGKMPITEYRATSSPGSIVGTNTTTTVSVTGLSSATSYTFAPRVSNIIGPSLTGAASLPVTATTVPERPIAGTAIIPTGQAFAATANASIPFTSGANGGKAITGFTVTSSSGNIVNGASSPLTVNETRGIPRLYTVTSANANGISSDSPNFFPNPLDIYAFLGPSPTGNNCTASRDASAGPSPANGTPVKMTFTGAATDPHFNMYATAAFNVGPGVYNQPITVSCYIKGNKNMLAQFFIFGANSNGNIIGGSFAAGNVSVTTSWARYSFTYTPTSIDTRFIQIRLDGPDSGGVAGDALWWDGLQVEYGNTMTAFNSNLRRSTTNVVVPSTVPQAPTIGTASRVNNSTATVNWTANDNGSSPLTSLFVESSPSISLSYTNTDLDGSVNVTGSFASNTGYRFRVRTANANGNSDFSALSNSVTINVPASYFNPPPPSYFNPPAPSYFNPPTPGYFNPPQTYFNPPAPSYFNPPAPSYFNPPPAYFNPPSYFNPPPSYFNPPKAPSFKCIYANSKVLTNKGYVLAKDIKVGDKLITVDSSNFTNVETLSNMMISESIKFTETEVVKNIAGRKTLIKFNDFEEIFSNQQPIFVKNGDGIKYKNTGEVTVDDILVRVNIETGNVYYVPVEKIEVMEQDDVYEIRTNPHLWFIVGESLVIS